MLRSEEDKSVLVVGIVEKMLETMNMMVREMKSDEERNRSVWSSRRRKERGKLAALCL